MDIKINVVGKVIKGDGVGSFIKILDDSESTGGVIILFSEDDTFSQVFDGWVEDYKSLVAFFAETDWVIEWSQNQQTQTDQPT